MAILSHNYKLIQCLRISDWLSYPQILMRRLLFIWCNFQRTEKSIFFWYKGVFLFDKWGIIGVRPQIWGSMSDQVSSQSPCISHLSYVVVKVRFVNNQVAKIIKRQHIVVAAVQIPSNCFSQAHAASEVEKDTSVN